MWFTSVPWAVFYWAFVASLQKLIRPVCLSDETSITRMVHHYWFRQCWKWKTEEWYRYYFPEKRWARPSSLTRPRKSTHKQIVLFLVILFFLNAICTLLIWMVKTGPFLWRCKNGSYGWRQSPWCYGTWHTLVLNLWHACAYVAHFQIAPKTHLKK